MAAEKFGPWGRYQHWIKAPSGKRHLIGADAIERLDYEHPGEPRVKCGRLVYVGWGDPEPRRTFLPEDIGHDGVCKSCL